MFRLFPFSVFWTKQSLSAKKNNMFQHRFWPKIWCKTTYCFGRDKTFLPKDAVSAEILVFRGALFRFLCFGQKSVSFRSRPTGAQWSRGKTPWRWETITHSCVNAPPIKHMATCPLKSPTSCSERLSPPAFLGRCSKCWAALLMSSSLGGIGASLMEISEETKEMERWEQSSIG